MFGGIIRHLVPEIDELQGKQCKRKLVLRCK
jgi:hypothetical protein